jgi:plasmid stabilization system protein ParE
MSSAPVTVFFNRLALREYRQARTRYARGGAAVEARSVAAVDAVIQRITMFPMIGAPILTHFRQLRIRRFPYTLNYHIIGPTMIEIVAVAHTSRRWGYWRRRRP